MDSKVKKGNFVGFDNESKGYRIYWPEKKTVSVERDVYFNKDEALRPSKVQIEGDWDISTNSDASQAPEEPKTTGNPSKTVPDAPETLNEHHPTENSSNLPIINSQMPNLPENESVSTPKQPARRNSLKGLQQFNPSEYGRGKRKQNNNNSQQDSLILQHGETAFVIDESSCLEPGGVELNETEWFREEMTAAIEIGRASCRERV